MGKLLITVLAAMFAQAALAANAAGAPERLPDTYYWLHPKQGYVKVDRATNAIVVRSQPSVAGPKDKPRPQSASQL